MCSEALLQELTTMDRKVARLSHQMAPCCRRLSEDLELSDVLQANKVTRRKPLVEKVTNAAFTCEKQDPQDPLHLKRHVAFACDVNVNSEVPTVPPSHTTAAAGENQGHEVQKSSPRQEVKLISSHEDQQMDIDNLSSPFGSISISVPERVTDIDDHDDLFFSPEYAQDIIDYMQARENHYTLSENFLDDNPEVTSQMRSILVDWLIQVQSYEQLEDETAQLTVALVDQYLARAPVPLLRLQLLGITCVFIAAKYIERFPPLVENLCALTAGTYVADEVLAMEHKVLKCLMFDVSMPLPNFFLARYFRVHLHDVKIKNLACYLIDLSLPSVHVVPVAPSLLAASALCLTRKLLLPQEAECWTPALAFYSKYSEKDLLQTVKLLAKILLRAPDSKYQGARSKHSDPSRLGVSMEPFLIGHPVLLQLTSEK